MVDAIKIDVINSMQSTGRYATGQTIKQIETVERDGKVQLLAPDYVDILERGRGPTSPNAPRAEPSVYDRIKQWCAAKGIDTNAAYPITRAIHKYGYKSKPGVLTEPLSDDNINKRANEVAGKLANLLITETLKF